MVEPRPTSATLIDLINDIEARFPVADWKLDGVRIWPLVRVRWFFAIWGAAYGERSRPTSPLARIVRYLAGIAAGRMRCLGARLSDRAAEDRTGDQREVVFLSDGVSFVDNAGQQYERFCDPIIELLGRRGISTMLLTPSHRYLRPRATPSVFVQPRLDIANLRGAGRAREMVRAAQLPQLEAVRTALAESGFDHPSLAPRRLAADGARVAAVAESYGRLLDRIRPRLAFIVSYYNLEGSAFALACRRRGIRLVDLQHGVQGPLHPAYGRLPAPPREGFELMPDRFWVWSQEEADTVSAWAGRDGMHRALVGGNLWLDRWLRSDSGMMLEIDAKARALRERHAGSKIVLVTLQWGLAESEQLQPLADLIAGSDSSWAWWVRMHPVMRDQRDSVRAKLAQTGNARVVVDEATDLHLYGLLRHVDVHLTHSSSTVLEALTFGVRSVVTSPYGAEAYPRQIEAGDAVLVESGADGVRAALARMAARRTTVQPATDRAERTLDMLLAEAGVTGRAA